MNDSRPAIQKKRQFVPHKDVIVREHVEKLLKACHIKEVQFPIWLSNVVIVTKYLGKQRRCVDFGDLNRACPKDCYPLARIEQLVVLCFLDSYQGYDEIPLAKQDRKKVSFITLDETFCYVVMLFKIKNVEETYQRSWIKFSKIRSAEM